MASEKENFIMYPIATSTNQGADFILKALPLSLVTMRIKRLICVISLIYETKIRRDLIKFILVSSDLQSTNPTHLGGRNMHAHNQTCPDPSLPHPGERTQEQHYTSNTTKQR